MAKNPLIGKRFRSVVADCNCLFEVQRTQGRGAYLCLVINEPIEIGGRTYPGEYAGQTKIFTKAEIEGSIRRAEYVDQMMADHAKFYASLDVGAIVHYHNGFGEFVRCEVVVLTEATRVGIGETYAPGTKVLRPIALVGPWREHDLRSDSYQTKKIREGAFMCPNLSNIYESARFIGDLRNPIDPRGLPACTITGQQEMFA